MKKHDLSKLRTLLMQEIESLQNGKTCINQAKRVDSMAKSIINSCLVEIAETKALPDNANKLIEVEYIDGTAKVLPKETM